jgi:hypothetical protein
MRAPLTILALAAALAAAGCGTNARSDARTDVPLPAPIDQKARADKALTAFLASRSIREVPVHRDATPDLDNDGTPDLLLLLDDMNWCQGDGCTLLVFRGGKDGDALVGEVVSVRAPVAVGSRVNRGWHDLLVNVGSGDEAGTVVLEFDGTRYPSDPTMAALLDPHRLPSATPLIDAELAPRVAAQ